jgi:hypothetical protein
MVSIVLVMSTTAFAAQPADANCWGDVTSGAATTDGRALGEHAKDPTSGYDQPRVGLPNVLDDLTGGVPTPRDPTHPSEVGAAVATC